MQQVSSSLTLILKLVVPTIWVAFFGAFTIAIIISEMEMIGNIPIRTFRIGTVLFFIFGLLFLYWAVMRLKRIEMDAQFVYVTNYHKNFRYPYHNIERMEENDYLLFRVIHIYLKKPGYFGKKITFLPSRKKFNEFLKEHPAIVKQFMEE